MEAIMGSAGLGSYGVKILKCFFTHGILKRIYEYFISTRQAQALLALHCEGSDAFFVRDSCCCCCLRQRRFSAKGMGIAWSFCAAD